MKRSVIFLTIIALVIIGISSLYNNALPARADLCCQSFHVQDSGGNSMEGFTITVTPCDGGCGSCQCVTDKHGNCTVCCLICGNSYTASASCSCNPLSGQAHFTACNGCLIVTITVQ